MNRTRIFKERKDAKRERTAPPSQVHSRPRDPAESPIPFDRNGLTPNFSASLTGGGLECRGDGSYIFSSHGGELSFHVTGLPEPVPIDQTVEIALPYGTEWIRNPKTGVMSLLFPRTVIPTNHHYNEVEPPDGIPPRPDPGNDSRVVS